MPWQDEIYQKYITNQMSPEGRKNYEYDINQGVIPKPAGWQTEAASQQAITKQMPSAQQPVTIPAQTEFPPAHEQETEPYVLDDGTIERFWSGKMSIEGMGNLMSDLYSGMVENPKPEEVTIFTELKNIATGEGKRVYETEQLPSWVYMPEMNNFSKEGIMSLIGTMASGPDEIVKILKTQYPEIKIMKDSKGNYVMESPMDRHRYAIKPGFRKEDILRTASTLLTYAIGGAKSGTSLLSKMGSAALTQFGIEASQSAAGGKFNAEEIPIASAFEGGGQLAGKGIAALKGYLKSAPETVKTALEKAGIKIGENIPTQLEQSVKTAESMGVKPMTSDVFPPKSFTQKTAQITGERIPVVGTASERVAQQKAREQAVKRVLSDYGADELAQASDDVTKDLLKRRSKQIGKYTDMKKEVIERLSGGGNGYDLDFPITHGSSEKSIKIKKGDGVFDKFDGIFGSSGTESAQGGKYQHTFYPRKGKVAGGRDVNLDYEKTIKFLKKEYPGEGEQFYNDVYELSANDKNVFDYGKNPLEKYGYEDMGEASWEYQNLRGKIAKNQGFDAIAVNDEFGESYLIPYGSKAKQQGKVTISNTEQTIAKEIDRLKALDNKDVDPIIKTLENAQESFSNKTLSQIEDNRKLLGETLSSDDFTKVKSQAEQVNRSLYKAVNEDMGEYIKTNGELRDFNKWKVANKRLEGMIGDLKKSSVKSVIKKGGSTPEEVRKLLFSNKPSDIKALYRDLTPEGKRRARVAIWQQALEKAGGMDNLSTAKFRTALSKLEKSTGVLFRGEDKRVLDGLIKTLDMTKRAETAGVQTPTGMQNFQIIGAFGLGTLAGGPKAAAIAGTIGTAARVYESRPVRNLLIKIAKGQGNEAQQISKLVNILRTYHQYNKPPVSAAEQRRALELIGQEI
jgi:hypothetical protein